MLAYLLEAQQRDAEGNAGRNGNANVRTGRQVRVDLVRHLLGVVGLVEWTGIADEDEGG